MVTNGFAYTETYLHSDKSITYYVLQEELNKGSYSTTNLAFFLKESKSDIFYKGYAIDLNKRQLDINR